MKVLLQSGDDVILFPCLLMDILKGLNAPSCWYNDCRESCQVVYVVILTWCWVPLNAYIALPSWLHADLVRPMDGHGRSKAVGGGMSSLQRAFVSEEEHLCE